MAKLCGQDFDHWPKIKQHSKWFGFKRKTDLEGLTRQRSCYDYDLVYISHFLVTMTQPAYICNGSTSLVYNKLELYIFSIYEFQKIMLNLKMQLKL